MEFHVIQLDFKKQSNTEFLFYVFVFPQALFFHTSLIRTQILMALTFSILHYIICIYPIQITVIHKPLPIVQLHCSTKTILRNVSES